MEIDLRRRFFAEELEAVCKLRSPRLIEALATVPREAFLPPGPWTVLTEMEFFAGGPRTGLTADADPARVNHNIAVAIDPARMLFNGQPGTLAVWIDALELAPGARVLHVGSGLGYYSAVMAHCAGPDGRLLAIEADEALASAASRNVASMRWAEVRHGDATDLGGETFDAILVNAGVTHPLDGWLDALLPGGRMVVPITATMPPMGNIGKGLVFVMTKKPDGELAARVLTVVAVYSAVGIRDDSLNPYLGKALLGGPAQWSSVSRLRRDQHQASSSCWLHTSRYCLAMGEAPAPV
jgi:protein-L-isoaspartate(D-aspartate) O-methyltransferase